MKITTKRLKQIIKEELEAIQAEASDVPLAENYREERRKRHEKECGDMIDQAIADGHIAPEEAEMEYGRCLDTRRMD